jgi:hypothetical protein
MTLQEVQYRVDDESIVPERGLGVSGLPAIILSPPAN